MLVSGSKVRRLTPRECERLQGMSDDYTLIPWDGWRKLDADETPEQCIADGMDVRKAKQSKAKHGTCETPTGRATRQSGTARRLPSCAGSAAAFSSRSIWMNKQLTVIRGKSRL